VTILLRKLQYYETIIYSIEGHPEKAKAKFNEKPMEKLLDELFRQIVLEESQRSNMGDTH
jgi:hypothetical protein